MILGQAFVYNKFLDSYDFPLSLEEIKSVQLLGLRKLETEDFLGLSDSVANQKLRDFFVENFALLLEENKLDWCLKFWQDLTSPIVNHKFKFLATSDFLVKLLDWKNSGYDLTDLEGVLAENLSALSENEFVIYYGLRVLAKISGEKTLDSKKLVLDENLEVKESLEEDNKPQILAILDKYLAPLFVNLNCQFLEVISEEKLLLLEIKKQLITNPELKLVILDNSFSADKLKFLQNNLPEILITSINTSPKAEKTGFFDTLVQTTLGVRLA